MKAEIEGQETTQTRTGESTGLEVERKMIL
jgi:hypothetical protein